MKKSSILLISLIISYFTGNAQGNKTAWDNTADKKWPVGFIQTDIKSSADSSIQKAVFYKTNQAKPQPLIVSLHTWSGNYAQEDPLTKEILLRDWNYIHPDFRGANKTPQACGSELVITDIEDAIQFAIKNGNVDKDEVHLIGVSGGGYATLLAFMKLDYPVKSFNAWASISSLEDWYWECKGRGLKYAHDIELVTSEGKGFDVMDARKRSPLSMKFQPMKRKGSSLRIYAGIHDGYTESVPITQSINFFNKLLPEMNPENGDKRVDDPTIISLLSRQNSLFADSGQVLGGRKIHLIRELPNLSLTIFEGGHEMIVPQALALLQTSDEKQPRLKILTIGDSNGAVEYGWPQQLRKLLPFSTIVNKSISGNTIGFDNLDQSKLNTLKNIDRYLEEACQELGGSGIFDYILINLGTNDTKRIFIGRQREVAQNMTTLVQMITKYMSDHHKTLPSICILTPSPMDEHKVNKEKYGGGDERIQKNNLQFKKVALKTRVDFLDTYTTLKQGFNEKTEDGVHLVEKSQFQMSCEIMNYLTKKAIRNIW